MLNSAESYEDWLIQRVATELGVSPEEIAVDQPLSSMGLNSQQFILLSGEMEDLLGIRLEPTLIFEYPTIQEIAVHLASRPSKATASAKKPLDFSLFFFSVLAARENPYALIEQAVVFADENHFHGVWVPERHFHELGGGSPNPALLCAALSQKTKRLRLKAGSVVAPLQDPLRTVEDWAMIDHLSQGRIELSLASGWHVDDFVLAPNNYENRKEILFERLEEIQKIWSGQPAMRINGHGVKIPVSPFPKPLQKKLPLWITAIGSAESFERAGKQGAHLLTCLLNQDIQELTAKIQIYRQALSEQGHGPRKVAVFIHTFVADSEDSAKNVVEKPFKEYLKSTLSLLRNFGNHQAGDFKVENLSGEQKSALLDFAFDRYFSERSLMGSPEKCRKMLQNLQQAGVDEIACLVDFGIESPQVMAGLNRLHELKKSLQERPLEI